LSRMLVATALVVGLLAAFFPLDGWADGAASLKAKVVSLKGEARYTPGNNTWSGLKSGDVFDSDPVTLQTGLERGAMMDVGLGKGLKSQGGDLGSTLLTLRMFSNSLMGIENFKSKGTGADEVTETELILRAGAQILGRVNGSSGCKLRVIEDTPL